MFTQTIKFKQYFLVLFSTRYKRPFIKRVIGTRQGGTAKWLGVIGSLVLGGARRLTQGKAKR